MAEMKGEQRVDVAEAVVMVPAKEKVVPNNPKRVASLDIFRGLTVAVLVFSLQISLTCFFSAYNYE